ncbi:MAG: LysR substrate-binding domain-containing protein [Bacteroidales bacterium]|nr:LysR substrate-binding domain-containing protein [Bacteroidales bacterium]
MTLQQLEYIIALESYGHFLQAAEACNITQPTLSATIAKLEEELDTQIFDRSKHPIVATEAGSKILSQAKVILRDTAKMKEMVRSERERETGEIHIGIITTIAPYIVPPFIKIMNESYPNIDLHITEAIPEIMSRHLAKGEIDVALMSPYYLTDNFLSIPVYHERFVAYVSPRDPLYSLQEIRGEDLKNGQAWFLNESLCTTNQLRNIANIASNYSDVYHAGSVDTLVRIVDNNGGFAIIPEFHLGLLREYQTPNIRPINTPIITREVSMIIRQDFVKEKLLNIIADSIRKIIPDHMISPNLKGHVIRI